MSLLSQKINLENRIFGVAARQHVCVRSRSGRLYARTSDPLLKALLEVYNGFFSDFSEREESSRQIRAYEKFWKGFFDRKGAGALSGKRGFPYLKEDREADFRLERYGNSLKKLDKEI